MMLQIIAWGLFFFNFLKSEKLFKPIPPCLENVEKMFWLFQNFILEGTWPLLPQIKNFRQINTVLCRFFLRSLNPQFLVDNFQEVCGGRVGGITHSNSDPGPKIRPHLHVCFNAC